MTNLYHLEIHINIHNMALWYSLNTNSFQNPLSSRDLHGGGNNPPHPRPVTANPILASWLLSPTPASPRDCRQWVVFRALHPYRPIHADQSIRCCCIFYNSCILWSACKDSKNRRSLLAQDITVTASPGRSGGGGCLIKKMQQLAICSQADPHG